MRASTSSSTMDFARIVAALFLVVELAAATDLSNNDNITRCYCNDPSCVGTGYMCKSTVGVCFARLSLGGDDSAHIRYACADQLSSADVRLCRAAAATGDAELVIRTRLPVADAVVGGLRTELACCATDMCNYYYFRSNGNEPASSEKGTTGSSEIGYGLGYSKSSSGSTRHVEPLSWCQTVVSVALPLLAGALLTVAVIMAARSVLSVTSRRRAAPCVEAGFGGAEKPYGVNDGAQCEPCRQCYHPPGSGPPSYTPTNHGRPCCWESPDPASVCRVHIASGSRYFGPPPPLVRPTCMSEDTGKLSPSPSYPSNHASASAAVPSGYRPSDFDVGCSALRAGDCTTGRSADTGKIRSDPVGYRFVEPSLNGSVTVTSRSPSSTTTCLLSSPTGCSLDDVDDDFSDAVCRAHAARPAAASRVPLTGGGGAPISASRRLRRDFFWRRRRSLTTENIGEFD